MIDNGDSILALLAGGMLSLFYFLGLWWTVRQLSSSKHVALLFLCSMLLRTSIVIAGFYIILGDNWQQILLGLLGFIVVRLFMTRFILLTQKDQSIEKSSLSVKHRTDYAP